MGPSSSTKHDVAIAAGAGRPRPLPSEERGEPTRLVVFLRRQTDLFQVGVGEDEVITLVGGEVDGRQVSGVGEVFVRCADANGGSRLRLRIAPADDLVCMIANHDGIGDGEDAVAVLENQSPHTGSAERDPVDPGSAAGIRAEVSHRPGDSASRVSPGASTGVGLPNLSLARTWTRNGLPASTMVGATAVKVSAGPLVMRKFGDVQ